MKHKMEATCKLARETLQYVASKIAPGVTTEALDDAAYKFITERGATPSPLGYRGYPRSICTSVNDVACHGIPKDSPLYSGDIINVDVTTYLEGYHGDTSATFAVGQISRMKQELIRIARKAMEVGIAEVRANAPIGNIGAAIDRYVQSEGAVVVDAYGGHGIGTEFHSYPTIPHVGTRGAGDRLREGMFITIEPIVKFGTPEVYVLDDGWTVLSTDGAPSAQFEHTLLVTKTSAQILT